MAFPCCVGKLAAAPLTVLYATASGWKYESRGVGNDPRSTCMSFGAEEAAGILTVDHEHGRRPSRVVGHVEEVYQKQF